MIVLSKWNSYGVEPVSNSYFTVNHYSIYEIWEKSLRYYNSQDAQASHISECTKLNSFNRISIQWPDKEKSKRSLEGNFVRNIALYSGIEAKYILELKFHIQKKNQRVFGICLIQNHELNIYYIHIYFIFIVHKRIFVLFTCIYIKTTIWHYSYKVKHDIISHTLHNIIFHQMKAKQRNGVGF